MKTAILGTWKLVEMDLWDLDYIDMNEPGHIAFKKAGKGQLVFGCVEAELDWREAKGEDRLDFSFMGFDEGDEVSGRGWVKFDGKKLLGFIAFHLGDESGFKAKKSK